MTAMAVIMLALSAAGLWWFGLEKHDLGPTPTANLIMLGALAIFVVLSIATLATTFTSATVLTAETIERRSLMGVKSMLRSDIAGCRVLRPNNSFPTMRLTSKHAGVRALTVTLYRPDGAFHAWFEGVPDLDEEDRKKAEQAVLEDPEFGADRNERKRNLARLGRIARVVNGLGVGLFFWVWIWPEPYWLAIAAAAAAPVVALGLIRMTGGRLALFATDARPTIGWLMYAGLAVPMRALVDIKVYHWSEGAELVLLAGAAAVLVSWSCDRRIAAKPIVFVFLALAVLAFAWGGVMEMNVLADRSRPQVFETQVLSKSISRGKHTSYDFDLAPWGDRRTAEDIDVGRALYDRTDQGSKVCAYLFRGAVGIRWFRIGACPS